MLNNREEIKNWLNQYNVENYTINDDLTVDVDNDVDLCDKNLNEIPIQFGIINGHFYCHYNNLISFKGCPIEVKGDFYCSNNKITNFQDCPKIIQSDFNCTHNHFNSINDLDSKILGNFIHGYYNTKPYKIIELNDYYEKSDINDNTMSLDISGKDLEIIVCEQYLEKNLPINQNTETKKLKI